MSKRVQKPKPTKGYGYVGVWSDNSVGWWMPAFLSQSDKPRCRFVMTVVHAGRIIHICDQEMVDWTLDRPKVQLNESCHADLAPFLGPR